MAHIVVIGAGGMGGYFAGLTAEAGHRVTLLARGPTLAAIRREGLTLDEPDTPPRRVAVAVVGALDDVATADVVLVCVKSWQVAQVTPVIAAVLGEHTVVIPVQNGVDAGDRLAAALGSAHAVGGSGFVFAMRAGAATFVRRGQAPALEIGALDDAMPPDRVASAAALLTEAGLSCAVSADIRRTLWRKLMFIASVGGVCAVSESAAGTIRELPRTRALVRVAMAEVAAVARAVSAPLDADDVARALAQLDGLAADATTSMARDLIDGKPSELFDQNGAVVRYGEWLGVETPVHQAIYAALLPRELRVRGRSDEPGATPPQWLRGAYPVE